MRHVATTFVLASDASAASFRSSVADAEYDIEHAPVNLLWNYFDATLFAAVDGVAVPPVGWSVPLLGVVVELLAATRTAWATKQIHRLPWTLVRDGDQIEIVPASALSVDSYVLPRRRFAEEVVRFAVVSMGVIREACPAIVALPMWPSGADLVRPAGSS